MIAVLVMTDGRDELLNHTLDAWSPVLQHPLVTERWMHDDTGASHREALARTHPDWNVIGYAGRRGFGGAIAHAWRTLRASSARYVLHLEDDFIPAQGIDLAAMVDVLGRRPYLAQMALRRQAVSPDEVRAGGVVERNAGDFTEVDGRWLEHRRFFTTNPSLYRRSLCERGWPDGLESEGRFSIALFASDPAIRCGYWGARDSGVWVQHIGAERVGTGY